MTARCSHVLADRKRIAADRMQRTLFGRDTP
jgi:hypothetical protein